MDLATNGRNREKRIKVDTGFVLTRTFRTTGDAGRLGVSESRDLLRLHRHNTRDQGKRPHDAILSTDSSDKSAVICISRNENATVRHSCFAPVCDCSFDCDNVDVAIVIIVVSLASLLGDLESS